MSIIMDRVARAAAEYSAQGWHRTGTGVDDNSARWLIEQLASVGVEGELEPVPIQRLDTEACHVEADGIRVPGLPLFDGGLTSPEGLTGRLGSVGSESEIGIAPASRDGVRQVETARREGHHAALALVTPPSAPGLQARNAPDFQSPFGPPVLQIESHAWAWLNGHADRASVGRAVVTAARTDKDAFNVVAHLAGSDPSLAPVVVMTPRSGWWRCAAERGGGIACWLEIARAGRGCKPPKERHLSCLDRARAGVPGTSRVHGEPAEAGPRGAPVGAPGGIHRRSGRAANAAGGLGPHIGDERRRRHRARGGTAPRHRPPGERAHGRSQGCPPTGWPLSVAGGLPWPLPYGGGPMAGCGGGRFPRGSRRSSSGNRPHPQHLERRAILGVGPIRRVSRGGIAPRRCRR